jgi:hypothetical protein
MARRATREGKSKVTPSNVGLTAKVVCIPASDSEMRIRRAVDLLLAAAVTTEKNNTAKSSPGDGT